VRPKAASRPPWERSLLDDVAMRRPWNIWVKAQRLRAVQRLRRLEDGVTVVIVCWNTREVVADVLRAVQALSPPGTRVVVVDNGSTDGSREMLRAWSGIDTLLLGGNSGHGVALDLALCRVATTVAVTLDSDALPLSENWLDPAAGPVRSGRSVLAGLRSSRDFVHPVYAAVDTRAFVQRRLSFQAYVSPGVDSEAARWGVDAWDTGELLTQRLAPEEVTFVEPSPNPVPDLPGMTAGGVVYHHGGVSRAASGGVSGEALVGWRDACTRIAAAGTGPASVRGAYE
jgi:hypothetical protein